MAGFSTTTTVAYRASSARLLTWLDKDGNLAVDSDAFDQLNDKVANIIRGYLTRRYGETVVTAWTAGTVPDLLVDISDDLVLWEMKTTNPKYSEQARQLRDDAMELLGNLADPEHPLELHDETPAVDDELYETETPDSDFDDFEN